MDVSNEVKKFFEQFVNSQRPTRIDKLSVNLGNEDKVTEKFHKGGSGLLGLPSEFKKVGLEFGKGISSATHLLGRNILSAGENFNKKISEGGGKFNSIIENFSKSTGEWAAGISDKTSGLVGSSLEVTGKLGGTAKDILTTTSPMGQLVGLAGSVVGKEGLDLPTVITNAFDKTQQKQTGEITDTLENTEKKTTEAIKNVEGTDEKIYKEVFKLNENNTLSLKESKTISGKWDKFMSGELGSWDKFMESRENEKKDKEKDKDEEKKKAAEDKKKDSESKTLMQTVLPRVLAGALALGMVGKDYLMGGGMADFMKGNTAGGIEKLVLGETTQYYKKDSSGKFLRDEKGNLESTGKDWKNGVGHVVSQAMKFGGIGYAIGGDKGGEIGLLVGAIVAGGQELWASLIEPWWQEKVQPLFSSMATTLSDIKNKGILGAIIHPSKDLGAETEKFESRMRDMSSKLVPELSSNNTTAEHSTVVKETGNYKDILTALKEKNASQDEIEQTKKDLNDKASKAIENAIYKLIEINEANGKINKDLSSKLDKLDTEGKSEELKKAGLINTTYNDLLKWDYLK